MMNFDTAKFIPDIILGVLFHVFPIYPALLKSKFQVHILSRILVKNELNRLCFVYARSKMASIVYALFVEALVLER